MQTPYKTLPLTPLLLFETWTKILKLDASQIKKSKAKSWPNRQHPKTISYSTSYKVTKTRTGTVQCEFATCLACWCLAASCTSDRTSSYTGVTISFGPIKKSNFWQCVNPCKKKFLVEYSYDSSLLWSIIIFQQNLPYSIESNKIQI